MFTHRGIFAFITAAAAFAALCPPAQPTAVAAECAPSTATGPGGTFAELQDFIVDSIDVSDVGPGVNADIIAALCDVAAAEYKPANSSIGNERFTVLKALAGTVQTGTGDEFIDTFLSSLGPDARNGTVEMDGRIVSSFVTSSGDGLAYAAGPTVVIGYVVPSDTIARGLDPAATQESAKGAYTKIIAAADGMPLSDSFFPGTGTESYPLGRGRYTTAADPGWVYFKTDDFKGATPIYCGIAPNGASAGCDMVPARAPDAPAGTNQTVVDASAPARYIHSDTKTFTRDVDVLTAGHRLENGTAICWINYQRPVHCEVGEHSFVLDSQFGTLE